MPTWQNSPQSFVVTGLDEIGTVFGRSRWTIRRWIAWEGFPAAKLPDGTWVVTLAAIDRWLTDRAHRPVATVKQ